MVKMESTGRKPRKLTARRIAAAGTLALLPVGCDGQVKEATAVVQADCSEGGKIDVIRTEELRYPNNTEIVVGCSGDETLESLRVTSSEDVREKASEENGANGTIIIESFKTGTLFGKPSSPDIEASIKNGGETGLITLDSPDRVEITTNK